MQCMEGQLSSNKAGGDDGLPPVRGSDTAIPTTKVGYTQDSVYTV